MNVGDLVEESCPPPPTIPESFDKLGIVIRIDDSHRQTVVDVLWPSGLERNIWERHLEVVSEAR